MERIDAEIYKTAGPVTLETFHGLLINIWEGEDIPNDFRDATVVLLSMNDGSKADHGNYLDISFLSIAGKNLACVILNCLITNISQENLPEV